MIPGWERDKATEIILFVAERAGLRPRARAILDIIYQADRPRREE